MALPLFHVAGIGTLFRTFLKGGCVVFADRKKTLSQNIVDHHITHLSLVPTQLTRLLNESVPFPSLKAALVGGAKTSRSLYEKAKNQKLPLYLTYGLTEMSSQVFTTKDVHWKGDLPFLGFPLLFRKAKIQNEKLIVSGKTLFQGYLGKEKPKFFATQDAAVFDPTCGFAIAGRKDRVFISGGENIDPAVIEKAILQIPGILKAKVLPKPDPEYGARPIAFIEGFSKDLFVKLKNTLPSYMIPDEMHPWEKISAYFFKEG